MKHFLEREFIIICSWIKTMCNAIRACNLVGWASLDNFFILIIWFAFHYSLLAVFLILVNIICWIILIDQLYLSFKIYVYAWNYHNSIIKKTGKLHMKFLFIYFDLCNISSLIKFVLHLYIFLNIFYFSKVILKILYTC